MSDQICLTLLSMGMFVCQTICLPGDREGVGGQLGDGVDGVGLERNRKDGHEAAAVADCDDEDAEDPQTDHNSRAGAAQPAHPHLGLLQHSSKHEI